MEQRLFAHGFAVSRLVESIHTRYAFPPIIASLLITGLLPYSTAFGLWFFMGDPTLISYGFLLAFLWLALCPYLIWKMENIADDFFKEFYQKAIDKERMRNFADSLDRTTHSIPGYLLGVPFVIGADYLSFLVFPQVSIVARAFLISYLSLLFLLAGLGFWGVVALIRMTLSVKNITVKTNPFNPDRFGGLEFAGSLCIKVTLFFSSGSLVFPLVFEAIQVIRYSTALVLANALTAAYIVAILVAFFVPTLALRDWFLRIKRSHLSPVSEQIGKMLERCLSSGTDEEKKRFYDLISFYNEIDKMKVWPFDLPVIVKLLGSISLPILVALIENFRPVP